MRKTLKKALLFLLALCLLLGLLPLGGLMAAAESVGAEGDVIKGTIPAPEEFGDNYVVTGADTQIVEIGKDMHDNPLINTASNASAPADAQAIVFRFSIPNIELRALDNGVMWNENDRWSHVSYWHYEVGGEFYYCPKPLFNTYYFKDDLTVVMDYSSRYINWANQLPLNCEGYAVVKIEDLRAEAQINGGDKISETVTVADIERMKFNQEWNWYEGLYNKQIYISNIGYVMDVAKFEEDFLASYKPAYEKGVMDPAGDVTAKADVIEGTFAELSWNEFEGANRYVVSIHTEDGFFGAEKTRKNTFTLEGLEVSTKYTVQIVPVDENDKILGASNALEITTKEKNTEAYTKDLLEYDETATVTFKNGVVTWDWIDGIDYYALHLYEKNGDAVTFVDRYTTDSKEGSYELTALKEGKEYVLQVVSYTADGSIVIVYTPVDVVASKATDSTTGNEKEDTTTVTKGEEDDKTEVTTPTGGEDIGEDDQTQTGVATTAGVLVIASILTGGAAVVTRKRR